MLFKSFLVCVVMVAPLCHSKCTISRARVLMEGKDSMVHGVLNMTEACPHQQGVRIVGRIEGLSPGKHGFHVHEFGDISESCMGAGEHYNPLNVIHGGPLDWAERRHAGDLGNIEADNDGIASIDITDRMISLSGPRSIAGRAYVVHANEDDFGRGNNEESKKTGNSGARLACGVVALVP